MPGWRLEHTCALMRFNQAIEPMPWDAKLKLRDSDPKLGDKPRLGDPKPRLRNSKPRRGVPEPRLEIHQPRLGDPKPRLGDAKPRLEDTKAMLAIPKPRLGVPSLGLEFPRPGMGVAAWLTVPIELQRRARSKAPGWRPVANSTWSCTDATSYSKE